LAARRLISSMEGRKSRSSSSEAARADLDHEGSLHKKA
jgi:hypothetical protein